MVTSLQHTNENLFGEVYCKFVSTSPSCKWLGLNPTSRVYLNSSGALVYKDRGGLWAKSISCTALYYLQKFAHFNRTSDSYKIVLRQFQVELIIFFSESSVLLVLLQFWSQVVLSFLVLLPPLSLLPLIFRRWYFFIFLASGTSRLASVINLWRNQIKFMPNYHLEKKNLEKASIGVT